MRPALFAAALVLASAVLWAGRLLAGPGPFAAGPASLLAADLVVLAAVAVVGVLVAGSRWARRLAVGVAAAGPLVGTALPVDPAWVVALAVSGAALALAVGPALGTVVRRLPAADGPPPAAVALPLLLLSVPALAGAALPSGPTPLAWVAVAVSTLVAVWYAKAWPGAVPAVRLLAPAALVAGALGSGPVPGVVLGLAAAGVAALAWTKAARSAARPLVAPGRAIPIPPELLPADLLEAAGLDSRGRRRRSG